MTKPRVIFMGTPAFAVPILKTLCDQGYDVVAVYSQPPRPSGRGYTVTPSPVHEYAAAQGIPVETPKSLRNAEQQAHFAAYQADLAIVVAYGLILPKEILAAPRLGCVNVHASLLPRWRGAAPIQRAIMAGDTETGITLMQMDEGLDTGPMLAIAKTPITPATTASSLHDQLSAMGADLIKDTLPSYFAGQCPPITQPEDGVTYAHKLSKGDGVVDWHQPASAIERQIRALTPWPGVTFHHEDTVLKITAATVITGFDAPMPGVVLDEQLTIACGDNTALRIEMIQKPGGKAMAASEFLRGYALAKGTQLPCPVTA